MLPESVELRYFDPIRLSEDLLPMHRVRIRDGLAARSAAAIR
jgi:hypothetical protein